ncbi:MAG TPA: hypothetical protein VGG74_26910 [Kofleriaceae bacterium]|jgi:hypothetical protein
MRCFLLAIVVTCVVAPRRVSAQVDEIDPSELPPMPAMEPPTAPFGAPGEIAISGTSGLGASYTHFSDSRAGSLGLSFAPAVDVFVARHLSVGVSAAIAYNDQRGYGADGSLVDTTTTTISAGARVGVDLPIVNVLSFWPRLIVGYEYVQQSEQAVDGGTTSVGASPLGYSTTTRNGPWAQLVLPLTLHVAPHVFAGFGPSIFREFLAAQGGPDIGGERTTVGAFLDVGGWFGGPTPPADPDDVPQTIVVRRFGSAHDFVINNAVVLQGAWSGYDGTNSSTKTFEIQPGVDFFVLEHLSVGISLLGTYNSGTGIDSTTGGPVSYSTHSFSAAPRVGVDIPLGTYTSLWPTASMGFGLESYSESETTSSNDENETYVWVALYAPVLVHLAPHFYVGFGPSVSTDLSRSITYPGSSASTQNRSTNVGAGFTVGGVL